MFSESVTGTIEGSIRGSIVGRTLVSHNNTGRRPDAAGLGSMISGGLGYSTVNGDDSLNTSASNRYKGNGSNGTNHNSNSNSTSNLRDGAAGDSDKKRDGVKVNTTKNAMFSILPDEDDDDGDEIEII